MRRFLSFEWMTEEDGRTLSPLGVVYVVGGVSFGAYCLTMAAAVGLSLLMGWPI